MTSKTWNIILWILQILVGGMFTMVGFMKTVTPLDGLIKMGMTWIEWSPILPRFVGICELLGGLGLILPALLRIKPNLTIVAGYCLAFVMVLAVIVHFMINQASTIGMPVLLGVLSYLIAWGRSKKAPVLAKA
ncbi:MAG: DoxX family protein [Chitinophagaceae bacterium]|nr:DoxX family protein [Chitinophagaceae bacterium]